MAEDILYLSLSGRKTAIHITGDRIYETYTPIDELAKKSWQYLYPRGSMLPGICQGDPRCDENDQSDQRRITGLRTPPQAGDRGAGTHRTAKDRSDIGAQ